MPNKPDPARYLLFGLFAVAAAYSVVACLIGALPMTAFLRALPTLLLVVAAALWSRRRYGLLVALGLLCGACGDYFLASAARDWFLPGLAAFLIGHVFYVVAFAPARRVTGGRLAVVAVTALGVAALTATVGQRLVATGETRLLAPVIAYSAVILAMAAAAVLHACATPLIAVGALIFVVSDAHIAVNHMLRETPHLALTVSGYATYYLGQGLIAAGAVIAASDSSQWTNAAARTLPIAE